MPRYRVITIALLAILFLGMNAFWIGKALFPGVMGPFVEVTATPFFLTIVIGVVLNNLRNS